MNDVNLTQLITNVMNNAATNTSDQHTLITILSLSCLLSILNRNPSEGTSIAIQTPQSNMASPLLKMLNELTKGEDGGLPPDLLMSLLPLINSPQLKSKMNSGNIASLFNMLTGMGGEKNDKTKNSNKPLAINEPKEKLEDEASTPPPVIESPPVRLQPQEAAIEPIEAEKKTLGHLNWKSNF